MMRQDASYEEEMKKQAEKQIDFFADIYLEQEPRERLKYIKLVNKEKYFLIGAEILKIAQRYGMNPTFKIGMKEFKEIVRRAKLQKKQYGRKVA